MIVGAVLGVLVSPGWADSAPAAVSAHPNPSVTESEAHAAAPVSPWDITSTLRASVGWRENVTVSTVQSINRGFWRAEAESFVVRPVGEHWQFISFLNADYLRYFNAPEFVSGTQRVRVSGEEQWAADLQARWQPSARFRTTLKGVGFIEDTFIDPSESEGEPLPATAVRFWGAYVALVQRVSLPAGFALEPSLQEKRIDFLRGYIGDYNESRPGVRLEWKHNEHLVLSAAWYDHVRHYSHLNPASPGRPIRDRLLGLRQHEGELKASSSFDARGKWTIAATVGALQNRDRTNGFLDYDQRRAELDLGWERGKWRVNVSGEIKRQKYLTQKVGFGIEQSARIADIYDTTARIERDLVGKWTVFAENRWERNRSNITEDPLFRFSYRTNTSLVGLQRSF